MMSSQRFGNPTLDLCHICTNDKKRMPSHDIDVHAPQQGSGCNCSGAQGRDITLDVSSGGIVKLDKPQEPSPEDRCCCDDKLQHTHAESTKNEIESLLQEVCSSPGDIPCIPCKTIDQPDDEGGHQN
jgi:hypothetical protein